MKILRYIECLLFFTVLRLIMTIVKELQIIGSSADFYSAYKLHPWEGPKALAIYKELLGRKIAAK